MKVVDGWEQAYDSEFSAGSGKGDFPLVVSYAVEPAGRGGLREQLAEDKRKRVEELIEEEEGATNRLGGLLGSASSRFAVFVSVVHLYAAVAGSPPFTGTPIIATYTLRPLHVGLVLALIYMLFPFTRSLRNRVTPIDWLCAAASLAIIGYILYQGADFGDRAIDPDPLDFYVGLCPDRAAAGSDPPLDRLDHAGGVAAVHRLRAVRASICRRPGRTAAISIERLVGHLYMTLEGIFGTTVDVSSSLIILFTIFGAMLQYSGAGKFFIDFSFAAMGGKRNAAGRAVVLSSFLLGGPRARASRPRSPSAPSPIRCWRRRATRRTRPAACSPRAGSAPSSRRRCSAPPPS